MSSTGGGIVVLKKTLTNPTTGARLTYEQTITNDDLGTIVSGLADGDLKTKLAALQSEGS